jgi:hypoxanthine phosphoribosyltransferase
MDVLRTGRYPLHPDVAPCPAGPGAASAGQLGGHGVQHDLERILFDEEQIAVALARLSASIAGHYGARPFLVVPVLKGSLLFAADLIRRLPGTLELSFAAARSYGAGRESGELVLEYLPAPDELRGREVLLVDDILDSGRTLARLVRELGARGAREVRTCVLLDKPARRVVPIEADWRGFEIADEFVVGYGLDLAGRFRNLPCIGVPRADCAEGAGR